MTRLSEVHSLQFAQDNRNRYLAELKEFLSIPSMRATSAVLETTFGVKPISRLEDGSVPVVTLMKDKLGIDSVLMRFGLPDDDIHAPNEKSHLPTYYRGITRTSSSPA